MSNPPPYGPYPPPYYGPPPPGAYPPPPPGHPPPPHPAYYVPGAVMMPYPMYPAPYPPPPEPSAPQPPTYVTNHFYNTSEPTEVAVAEEAKLPDSNHFVGIEWVPATNTTSRYLEGRAVVAGHEGWDGSPLWVIRASHNADLIPGKLSIRHSSAYIPYAGKEVAVQNLEVLCAPPGAVRWIPSGNGRIPPNAVPGGNTASGEPLYIGRARYQLSLTPGKIHPSHQACYISFGGNEIAHKMYDVLCRV